jgi:Arc/MetJ family transcription regulator
MRTFADKGVAGLSEDQSKRDAVISAARALLERIDRTNAQRGTRYGPNAPAREALREALAALDHRDSPLSPTER